jgi:hypothetical protein
MTHFKKIYDVNMFLDLMGTVNLMMIYSIAPWVKEPKTIDLVFAIPDR